MIESGSFSWDLSILIKETENFVLEIFQESNKTIENEKIEE